MAIIFPDIDPVILTIAGTPLKITWYSLSYVVGILLSWYYIKYLNKKNTPESISTKAIDDLITYIILGIILGGRIGYVIFYDLETNLQDPWNALRTWEGGMSYHGGLIGVIIATLIYCKIHKISFFKLMDMIACATPIGLFLGRIANFINAELYGRITNKPWGVIFPGQAEARHPSQLYEACLEGALLFIILFFLYKKLRKFPGMISGLFLLFYAVFRGIIENYRQPDEHLGFIMANFTMGQLLSAPMILVGTAIIIYSLKSRFKN